MKKIIRFSVLLTLLACASGCATTPRLRPATRKRKPSYTLVVTKGRNDTYTKKGNVDNSIVERCFKKKPQNYDQMGMFPPIAFPIGIVFIEANGVIKKVEILGWKHDDKPWAFSVYGVLPEISGVADTREGRIKRIIEVLEKGPPNKSIQRTAKRRGR